MTVAMYKVVDPIDVTDAMLVSSSVAEDSTAVWVSGATYTAGDFVHRVETHRVYVDLAGGVSTTAPEDDSSRWTDVLPTTRWAMFDYRKTTKTADADEVSATLRFGQVIDTLAVYAATGQTVTVTQVDATDGTVYSDTAALDASSPQTWWEWFFGGNDPVTKAVFTGLLPYADAEVTVTLSSPGAEASLGALVAGRMETVGATKYGLEIEQKDYSTIETDIYGVTSFVARETSNVMDADIEIANELVNSRFALMERITGRPALFIGACGMDLLPSVILGWKVQFKSIVDYFEYSSIRLKVQEIA